jgi:protein O-GlcNAc transferase
MRLGRHDVALDFYNKMLAVNANDISALLGRAIAWQRMGQLDAAENAYRDVLRRDKNNVTAATNLASIQSQQSPERAIKNLSKVYQDNPNDSSIKGQLGVSMAQSGDVEQAYKSFLSATQNDPKNPQHFFNLAVTSERLGKRSEAISAYEKCLEVDAIYGTGRGINRDVIYDRLTKLRGQ